MSDVVKGRDAISLLKAYGHAKDAERKCLSRLAFAKIAGHSCKAVRIEVWDASDGGAPHEGTTAYRAVCSSVASNNGLLKDIVFKSDNAADIAAFTVACVTKMRVDVGFDAEEWETFVTDTECIHNCFGDPNYGDWVVAERGDGEIVVANPEEVYGDLYLRWRDRLVKAAFKQQDGLGLSGPSLN